MSANAHPSSRLLDRAHHHDRSTRSIALFFFISCILFVEAIHAQYPQPAHGRLFDPDHVSRFDVLIPTDSLNALLDPSNAYSNHEYRVTAIYTDAQGSDTLQDVGFRLRGNTSRNAQKKSFKISVNAFQDGRRFKGVKKINLNGQHNDPSMSRAFFSWKWGRILELPVSRSRHSELYINGNYYGLYTHIEHINDDWLRPRFGNDDGNLYKCVWPADLTFISSNPDDYKFTRSDGRRAYELKTNEQEDDYSDLALLISVIEQTPLNQLECALDELFDLEGFLQVLAYEVITGHWDNYAYNKNNYYLYNDPATGKFHFIPYDMDNTLGIDWVNKDWAQRDVLNWINSGMNLPLVQRLFQLPEVKEIYAFYLRKWTAVFTQAQTQLQLDSIRDRIDPYAASDSFRTLDYGFDQTDFFDSFNGSQSMGHVDYSISDYLSARHTNTQNQLGSFDAAPILQNIQLSGTGAMNELKVTVGVEDEGTPNVQIEFDTGTGLQTKTLSDNGVDDDGIAGNGVYGTLLVSLPVPASIQYQIVATDAAQNQRRRPCQPQMHQIAPLGQLIINELMADNGQTVSDEDGDFGDWIELHNRSSDPIWLADYFLSDDLSDPRKWQLPAATMAPGEFKLIWASKKHNVHAWHSNFKLSKDGESVGLFREVSGSIDTVDMILFGPQTEDISYGRSYDGSPLWVLFGQPTPAASNGTLSTDPEWASLPVKVGPNPFSSSLYLTNPTETDWTYTLFDLWGRSIHQGRLPSGERLETNWMIPQGTYVLRLQNGMSSFTETLIRR
jgi:hypothetical protein